MSFNVAIIEWLKRVINRSLQLDIVKVLAFSLKSHSTPEPQAR